MTTLNGSNAYLWMTIKQEEIKASRHGKFSRGCKWIYKIKWDDTHQMEQYCDILVVNGYV